MTVHFIGAGPGAADLLTLRGRDLIARCPVCLYAGSLVSAGVLAHCPPDARIIDTAPLSLDEIIAEMKAAQFTLPEVAQTVILTRTAMQSSSMPPGEMLEELGRSGATLAIHLSIRNLGYIERALTPHYGADCPVVVAYRITWPDQMIIRGTLSTIAKKVREAKLTRTALILVGRVLDAHDFRDSALYDVAHEHVLRNRKTVKAAG